MINPWIRLWVEMPHDPKFRIVAKISGQPIALVMATYVYMMCDANNCHGESRGVTKCHDEEIAVTLECDIEQIVKIKDAMQGRLLDGNMLSGWEKRQPKREDIGNPETGAKSAAERKRAQRANAKQDDKNHDVTQCHDASRNVPLDKIREDKNKESARGADSLVAVAPKAPPSSLSENKKITFKAWREGVKVRGEKLISGYQPVWDYAEKLGIPVDWIEIAWLKFADRYAADPTYAGKRYADWQRHFLNAIEGNWFGLWRVDQSGKFSLTTVGVQADIGTREAA